MPAEQQSYDSVSADYFAKRGLRRYAGVASLWALGVGAVISGHYSGWNLGLMAGGWGGFALAGAGRGVRDGEVSSSCRTAGLQARSCSSGPRASYAESAVGRFGSLRS